MDFNNPKIGQLAVRTIFFLPFSSLLASWAFRRRFRPGYDPHECLESRK